MALPTNTSTGSPFRAALVLENNEARRLVAALADREEGTHAEFFGSGLIQDFAFETEFLRQLAGLIRQISRSAYIRRGVAQVLGEAHAAGNGLALFDSGLGAGERLRVGNAEGEMFKGVSGFGGFAFQLVKPV